MAANCANACFKCLCRPFSCCFNKESEEVDEREYFKTQGDLVREPLLRAKIAREQSDGDFVDWATLASPSKWRKWLSTTEEDSKVVVNEDDERSTSSVESVAMAMPRAEEEKKRMRKYNTLEHADEDEELLEGLLKHNAKEKLYKHMAFSDIFEMKEQIGKGASCRVYKAVRKVALCQDREQSEAARRRSNSDQLQQKVFAVKVMSKIANRRSLALLRNELSVLEDLKHKNVIKLYGYFECAKTLHVVTEYIQGVDLLDWDTEEPTGEAVNIRSVIYQVLSALEFIHSRGIMHRDMKLENVVIEPNSLNIKLIDFGLAKQCQWNDHASKYMMISDRTCGTPDYMAPEILFSKSYNEKIDVFAVGVMAYMLTVREMPIDTDFVKRFYILELEKKPASKEAIKVLYTPVFDRNHVQRFSKNVIDFVRAAMEIDPTKRVSAEKALLENWFTARTKPMKPIQQRNSSESF